MGLTNENVESKILAKIKIYVLTRAELLFQVCYEIPCRSKSIRLTKQSFSQCPFLSIFVQNCPKVYNMICDYFNFFLHFSIAYIKSFQDMYHKFHQYCTYILRKCKNIGYFAVLLEKSDFYYWPMLEKGSKISLVHICATKLNLL